MLGNVKKTSGAIPEFTVVLGIGPVTSVQAAIVAAYRAL
jgi:hypothetical protein